MAFSDQTLQFKANCFLAANADTIIRKAARGHRKTGDRIAENSDVGGMLKNKVDIIATKRVVGDRVSQISTYKYDVVDASNVMTDIINSLTNKNYFNFLKIPDKVKNLALQPFVQLYKTTLYSDGSVKDLPLYFSDRYNHTISAFSLESNPSNRDSGVLLQNIELTRLAGNPAEINSNIVVSIVLHADKIGNFFVKQGPSNKPDQQRSWIDLIKIDPSQTINGTADTYDEHQQRIKLAIGYVDPNKIPGLKEEFSSSQLEYWTSIIQQQLEVFYLSLKQHSFNFREDGSVDLQIDYVASAVAIQEVPESDLFADPVKKQTEEQFEAEIKTIQKLLSQIQYENIPIQEPGQSPDEYEKIAEAVKIRNAKVEAKADGMLRTIESFERYIRKEKLKVSQRVLNQLLLPEHLPTRIYEVAVPISFIKETIISTPDLNVNRMRGALFSDDELLIPTNSKYGRRSGDESLTLDYILKVEQVINGENTEGLVGSAAGVEPAKIGDWAKPKDEWTPVVAGEETEGLEIVGNGQGHSHYGYAGDSRLIRFVFFGDIIEAALELLGHNNRNHPLFEGYSGEARTTYRSDAAQIAPDPDRHGARTWRTPDPLEFRVVGGGGMMSEFGSLDAVLEFDKDGKFKSKTNVQSGIEGAQPPWRGLGGEDLGYDFSSVAGQAQFVASRQALYSWGDYIEPFFEIIKRQQMTFGVGTVAGAEVSDESSNISKVLNYFGHILCTDISYRSASDPDVVHTVNLADLPISYEHFRSWWFNKAMAPVRESYYLGDFIHDMMTELIQPALGTNCVDYPDKYSPPEFQINSFNLPGSWADLEGPGDAMMKPGPMNAHNLYRYDMERAMTRSPAGDGGLWFSRINGIHLDLIRNRFHGSPEKGPSIKFEHGLKGGRSPTYNVTVLHQVPKSAIQRSGNRRLDEENGIYHIIFGESETGLIKSMEFSKEDLPGLREARLFHGGGFAGTSIIREKYNASITMVGNIMFKPGSVIYVQPKPLDLGFAIDRRQSNASRIGLGGYFLVLDVQNYIELAGGVDWETSLTTKFLGFAGTDGTGNNSVGASSGEFDTFSRLVESPAASYVAEFGTLGNSSTQQERAIEILSQTKNPTDTQKRAYGKGSLPNSEGDVPFDWEAAGGDIKTNQEVVKQFLLDKGVSEAYAEAYIQYRADEDPYK